MAQYFKGTLLASPIVRGSSEDTYGTHHSVLGVGGYMEVNNLTERNSIPTDTVNGIGYDGISSGQRRIGMLVYVHSENIIYQLQIPQSSWTGMTNTSKMMALANNDNWEIFSSGSENGGERIYKQFKQLGHGFIVGDVIGHDGIEFVKIDTTTAANIEPLGIVSKVIDSDNFNLTFSGYISTVGITDINSSELTDGTIYYLSNVSGKLTETKPTGITEIVKPILVTLSGETGIVLQYMGLTSNDNVSNETFTGYTATTQVHLDNTITGATNVGFFTGTTGIQTLPINYLTNNDFDGDYISQYNNYYRDSNGYIKIGIPTDGYARRAYVRNIEPKYSWIWNDYTGDSVNVGWIFVKADVTSDSIYGNKVTGSTNITSSTPTFTETGWTEGNFYVNGSNITIDTVIGNLTTGDTYNGGGPVYKEKEDQELKLRTLISNTPDKLSIEHDNYFIKFSANTGISDVKNIGLATGVGIYSGTTGNTILLKKLVGGGGTTIIDDNGNIVISSSVSGGTGGSGENITKTITQFGHGFSVGDVVGYSGNNYSKAIADGNYDGEIIGIVSEVVDINNFNIIQSGYIDGLSGLVKNTTYFVSPTTAGDITNISPTIYGNLVKPILFADSTTTGWVLPYSGYILTKPITGGTTGGTVGSLYYTGETPSNITVGGLSSGSELTGRTLSEILEEILITTFTPTYIVLSNSFSEDADSTYEVGTTISTINFNSSFDKGQILLEGSFQNYRSGDVNCYYYNGVDLPSTVSSTNLTDNQSISNYVVQEGVNSWSSCIGYDQGPQPLDSDGNPYDSPLSAGITTAKSVSLTGYYNRFYGPTSTTPTNSSEVRSLTTTEFQTANVNSFCLNTGDALTKFVVALPPSRTIASVFDLDSLNANITSEYICLGKINVNDGGGSGTIREYNLYEMNVGSSYSSNHRHEITTG